MPAMSLAFCFFFLFSVSTAFAEELTEIRIPHGHTLEQNFKLPQPHTYISPGDLPDSFHWGNVHGKSYLTRSLNQHIVCKVIDLI